MRITPFTTTASDPLFSSLPPTTSLSYPHSPIPQRRPPTHARPLPSNALAASAQCRTHLPLGSPMVSIYHHRFSSHRISNRSWTRIPCMSKPSKIPRHLHRCLCRSPTLPFVPSTRALLAPHPFNPRTSLAAQHEARLVLGYLPPTRGAARIRPCSVVLPVLAKCIVALAPLPRCRI